jgi:hypothetical protein
MDREVANIKYNLGPWWCIFLVRSPLPEKNILPFTVSKAHKKNRRFAF